MSIDLVNWMLDAIWLTSPDIGRIQMLSAHRKWIGHTNTPRLTRGIKSHFPYITVQQWSGAIPVVDMCQNGGISNSNKLVNIQWHTFNDNIRNTFKSTYFVIQSTMRTENSKPKSLNFPHRLRKHSSRKIIQVIAPSISINTTSIEFI